jgi:hypothetical protein
MSTDGWIDFTRVTLSMDGRTMAVGSSGECRESTEWQRQLVFFPDGTMWNLRGHPRKQP